jgi:type VI secretion system protein ImpK
MYLCLSLGFEGRLRVERGGGDELNRLRDGLYRTIRNHRGEIERDLSPNWRGLEVGYRPLSRRMPLWVIFAATAGLLAVVYIGVSYLLNAESDRALAALATVPAIDASQGQETSEPAPTPEPGALRSLRAFLEPEIKQGLVEVFAEGQAVIVRLRSVGMFASGSARLSETARRGVNRVAEALREEPGPITITGHTDNVPIRTPKFPSNWKLSKARAQSAADVIATELGNPGRISVEGRGAAEPIASNETEKGRARNRRIEIKLRPDRPLRVDEQTLSRASGEEAR